MYRKTRQTTICKEEIMKQLLVFILSLWTVELFAVSSTIQKKVGSIEGTVIDRSTYQQLPGVNIIIVDTTMGAATDLKGRFLIKNVPIGTYQIEASMIGYQPEVKTEIVVSTNRVTMIDFELSQKAVLGEEVVVKAGYFKKDTEKPISSKTLTPQEIRSSAGAVEDIFRVIKSMPGVSVVGMRSANLIVRGGAPDENRTLLENIEIYNPLHFGRPGGSMGGISIINLSLLQRVDFLTGGFPAKYGDKMSSVFEMRLKEGNRTDFNTDLNLNMAGFGVQLDGPIPGNGTMLFAARRGFFDLLTPLINEPALPRYWDLVGKATYNMGVNHKLSPVGFYYHDNFEQPPDSTEDNELERKYTHKRDDYGSAIGLNWRYLFSKHGYMLTTAALISNGWKSSFSAENNPKLIGDDIKEDEAHLKSELTYKLSDVVEVKGGLFWKTINSNQKIWNNLADTTGTGFIIPAYKVSYNPPLTFKAGSFLQATLRPFTLLSINTGLRYDYFEFTEESKISPRLGLRYSLTNITTLNAAYGHYYQTPAAHQVAIEPANTALHSSHAIHYIAGIEHLLYHDTKISVEVYHKELDDVFVDSDTSRVLTNAGSGYAHGIELYLQKKMSKNLVGSVAYTYSISKRKDGVLLPECYSDYDQPHNFTLVSGYKLSDNWQIGVKFQYASGSPYTPVIGAVQKDDEWYVVEGDYNSERYPDYHKLDIRIDRRFHFSNWTLTTYVDVWNAYNRKNVFSYYYDVADNGVITKEVSGGFPLIPILGISAQF